MPVAVLLTVGVLVVLVTASTALVTVTLSTVVAVGVPSKFMMLRATPVAAALLLYVPSATLLAILATKVIATLPLAGMLNVPQAGVVAPAAGLLVAVRVAPPPNTGALFEAKVNPDGRVSVSTTPVADPVPLLVTVTV